MPAAESDARLLERIRNDDPGAFDDFVESWQDRIYGFGLRICGERENARDVLQDTLLQSYRSLKDLRHPAALKAWVFRVATNACLMMHRKGKFDPEVELSLDDLVPGGPDRLGPRIPSPDRLPDEQLERGEMARLVRAAVRDLPYDYRMVVVLRDLEQLTTKEAAHALDLPDSTVKMRLHRGRLMVRRALQEHVEGAAPDDA